MRVLELHVGYLIIIINAELPPRAPPGYSTWSVRCTYVTVYSAPASSRPQAAATVRQRQCTGRTTE